MTGNVGGVPEVGNATASDGRHSESTFGHLLTHPSGYAYTFFHPTVMKWQFKTNGAVDES
ncbi:BZ3500_MvSof-1268-A1-R1_Chr4-3g07386 [Microbotryum saponariae]|uniref:BZ3500_MvSof-1268-A1-R1_Chr4-3g07386 protein n=1 Tax=Microbotryum saponariae TaxID=289078 RepID=A0A2X0LFR0_9BASI|nr:BZ3500_MvSof-1268-A1-R1_Chr4-3g07386 [Microbotryum saponariae]SDA07049.1 BZ3501_MvSof-1269-A2-R1_Chr4-2g07095 [Microbotryum saponariae]